MSARMYAYVACVFVVVFYAGNILVGATLSELPPFTVSFFRVTIAAVLLAPLGWRTAWEQRGVFRRHAGPLLLLAVTGVAFFNTFIYAALHFTSATNVSVLEAVIPVATAVLSAWLLRERLRWVQWAGVLVSLCGAVWVVRAGAGGGLSGWNFGDLIMVGAILTWALYSIAVRRYLHLFPEYGALLVMSVLAALLLAPFVAAEWLSSGVPPALGQGAVWAGLGYLGLFPAFIALLLYNRAVATLGASQAAVFLNFLPVVTMLGAFVFLGEDITLGQVLGAVLVITGVLLTTRTARRRPRPVPRDIRAPGG